MMLLLYPYPVVIQNASGNNNILCVKSIQIWSYFWSVFFFIRTEYGEGNGNKHRVRVMGTQAQNHVSHWSLDQVIFGKSCAATSNGQLTPNCDCDFRWGFLTPVFMQFILHVIICFSKNAMSPLSKHEKTQLEIPNIEIILILNIVI